MTTKKETEQAIEILSKKYPDTGMTTLNRMRKRNQNVSSPFKILMSCLLSLRARDENTEKVSEDLFKIAETPEQISKLPIKKLEKTIYSSGHYRKKAKTLKEVSKEIIERFRGKVPEKREELTSIKGIGPKTANIVLAFAFKKPVIPVDTHVHRIPNRLGWIKTEKPEETEKELMKIIPRKHILNLNAIFVQFGRDVCQPVSPWCSKCPINKYCKKINVGKNR